MKTYRLEMMPYCENCEGFEVKVEEGISYCKDKKIIDRTLTCKYASRCLSMYRHLDKEYKRLQEEDHECERIIE